MLALRLLPPLLLGAAACAALARLGWPAVQTLGLVAPMLLCAVAPVAPQVSQCPCFANATVRLCACMLHSAPSEALPAPAALPLFIKLDRQWMGN